MKKLTMGIATTCMFALGLLAPASVAQAHATCAHYSHEDWHWADFHYDTHAWGGHLTIGGTKYDNFYNQTHPDWGESWNRYCGH